MNLIFYALLILTSVTGLSEGITVKMKIYSNLTKVIGVITLLLLLAAQYLLWPEARTLVIALPLILFAVGYLGTRLLPNGDGIFLHRFGIWKNPRY